MNLYEVLGASPDASVEDLRRAYRARARALHPDRHPSDPAADEAMRLVNAAWAVLSHPDQRAAYDRRLAGGGGAPQAPDGWAAQPTGDPGAVDLLLAAMTRRRPVRVGLSLVLLVTLFVLFVVTAYAGGGGASR